MTSMSQLWADPLAAMPDHTPDSCLSALISQTFGGPATHAATECLEPPPTHRELCYLSWCPPMSEGEARQAILDLRARRVEAEP